MLFLAKGTNSGIFWQVSLHVRMKHSHYMALDKCVQTTMQSLETQSETLLDRLQTINKRHS